MLKFWFQKERQKEIEQMKKKKKMEKNIITSM